MPPAEKWIQKLVSVQETLLNNIKVAKEHRKLYFDKKIQECPTYETGDWVWLLRHNIATTLPSNKFDFKQLGPILLNLPLGKEIQNLSPEE
ncbi:hypothetical protein PGTUg99_008174 [Puccinia graminis f. sp. tritici]|uniref:Uncharacterized protein n=1 Tax=Puccinia graminis f. sp. tritici TaxID=56615 RepID=A0A5B0N7A6_PUCGR|nr:hypothetical protein PGTUg99_008174 [Puccinia graminis f. sp. tritici]